MSDFTLGPLRSGWTGGEPMTGRGADDPAPALLARNEARRGAGALQDLLQRHPEDPAPAPGPAEPGQPAQPAQPTPPAKAGQPSKPGQPVAGAAKPQEKPPAPDRAITPNIGRQALAGLGDAYDSTVKLLETVAPLGGFAFEDDGLTLLSAEELRGRKLAKAGDAIGGGPPKGVVDGLARDLTQFFAGFLPALKALKAAGAGAGVAGAGAGAVADFTVFDAAEGNLANLWKQAGLPDNALTDLLAAEGDDGEIVGRLKNAGSGAVAGAVIDGLVWGARALRAVKRARGAGADGAAAPKSVADDLAEETPPLDPARDMIHLGDPLAALLTVRAAGEAVEPAARLAAGMEAAGADVAKALGGVGMETPATTVLLKLAKPEGAPEPLFEALDQIRAGAGRKLPAGVVRLSDFLREQGGVLDEGGDLAAFDANRARPGLINKRAAGEPGRKPGLPMDEATLRAWEAGYLPGEERPDINALIEALRRDLEVAPVTSEFDAAAVAQATTLDSMRRELDEMGIGLDLPNGEIRARLQALDEERARFVNTAEGAPPEKLEVAPGPGDRAPDPTTPPGVEIALPGGRKGFVNLARIRGPEDLKAAMAAMADAFRGSIDEARRGVQSNEETERLAADLGMTVGDVLARRRGQPFNAEEALAARRLWAASSAALLDQAKKIRAEGPGADGRNLFVFRRLMAVNAAIQQEVIGARTETARALQAWSIPAGSGQQQALAVKRLVDGMGGAEASEAMAKRLAILADAGSDPAAIAAFARKAATATTWEAVREVWINGLLSSPKTHVVNVTSNTLVALQQIYERFGAEAVGSLRGAGPADRVAPGEAAAMTYGLVTGLREAFVLAAKGQRIDDVAAIAGNAAKVEERVPAFGAQAFGLKDGTGAARAVDYLGAALRTPSNLLEREDIFFQTIGYRMNLHAEVARQVYAEGLSGPQAASRAHDLLLNPPENIKLAAADAALYQTFTNKAGALASNLMRLRENVPAVSLILPFVRTPANIVSYAFERGPLAPLSRRWREDFAAGGARRDIAVSRMATGSTIMLLAADMADAGQVSGSGKTLGPQERENLRAQGWQPYSVKVGDRWYSYNRLDPFGMTMGFAADLTEALKKGDVDAEDLDEFSEVAGAMIGAITNTTISKTYLSGLAEFFAVAADANRYAADYVEGLIASFTPFSSLVRSLEQAIDPTASEVTDPVAAIYAMVPGLSDRLPVKRDLFGEPVRSGSGFDGTAGRAFDFLSPVVSPKPETSAIRQEFQRLGFVPSRIAKVTEFQGVGVNFRKFPETYDAYVRLAGNELKHPATGLGLRDFLDALVTGRHPLSPLYRLQGEANGADSGKAVFIRGWVQRYREEAQRQILADPQFAAFRADWAERKGKRDAGRQVGTTTPPRGGLPTLR